MNLSQQIIDDVDAGASPAAIAAKYPWEGLSLLVREELFEELDRRRQEGRASLPLLKALFVLTSGRDPWAEMRVLVAASGDEATDKERREGILERLKDGLTRIYDSVGEDQVCQFLHYRGEYYILKAQMHIDDGDLDGAIGSYEQALKSYEKATSEGSSSSPARIVVVKQDLDRLRSIQAKNQHLVPWDALESESLQLQQQISERAEELEGLRNDIQDRTTEREDLTKLRDQLKREIEEYEGREREVESLKKKIRQHEAGLQFLVALPQAATAPLWVEVVRLALQQGEIDSLAQDAVERLALEYPEEALPLLSEIAARTPGGFSLNEDAYQACTRHWMGKIAEARRLREEDGIRAAAKALVEAWDAYSAALGAGSA